MDQEASQRSVEMDIKRGLEGTRQLKPVVEHEVRNARESLRDEGLYLAKDLRPDRKSAIHGLCTTITLQPAVRQRTGAGRAKSRAGGLCIADTNNLAPCTPDFGYCSAVRTEHLHPHPRYLRLLKSNDNLGRTSSRSVKRSRKHIAWWASIALRGVSFLPGSKVQCSNRSICMACHGIGCWRPGIFVISPAHILDHCIYHELD